MPTHSPEPTLVELPFVQQLEAVAPAWQHLPGDIDVPYLTERDDFRQVLLLGRLRQSLRAINLDNEGNPWLDDARINGVPVDSPSGFVVARQTA
jgi:type I restriction enzyme R subunit